MIYKKLAAGNSEPAPTRAELDALMTETHAMAVKRLNDWLHGPDAEARAATSTLINSFDEVSEAQQRRREWDRLKAAQHLMQCATYFISIPVCELVINMKAKDETNNLVKRTAFINNFN